MKLDRKGLSNLREYSSVRSLLRFPLEDRPLFDALLDLAFEALDGEADRKLGAVVRAAVDAASAADACEYHANLVVKNYPSALATDVLRACAVAFREEGKQ